MIQHWIAEGQHWIAIHLGLLNAGPDHFYNFWSGFGSDISEIALIGALIGMFRHHNCSVTGCLRTRTFPVDGTPWKACKKHHPHIDANTRRVTPERIASFFDRHPKEPRVVPTEPTEGENE